MPCDLPCDTVVLTLGTALDVEWLDEIREIADVRVVGDAVAAAGPRASSGGPVCGLSI